MNGKKLYQSIFDWAESGIAAIVAVIVIFTFFARVTRVDGESMMPTLINNDRLLIYDFLYTPARNDIVVLQAKGEWESITDAASGYPNGKPIVKRIIAVAGDKVDINFDTGIVYINGKELEREEVGGVIKEDGHTINALTYTPENLVKDPNTGKMTDPSTGIMFDGDGNAIDVTTGRQVSPDEVPYGFTVPKDSVFVMGDNRGNSTDGRYLGCVDRKYLVGKVFFRLTHKFGGVV